MQQTKQELFDNRESENAAAIGSTSVVHQWVKTITRRLNEEIKGCGKTWLKNDKKLGHGPKSK